MIVSVTPLDLSKLKVFPLAERKSLTRADEILIEPDAPLEAVHRSGRVIDRRLCAGRSRLPARAGRPSC